MCNTNFNTTKSFAQQTNIADSLAWNKINQQAIYFYEKEVYDSSLVYANKGLEFAQLKFGTEHVIYTISLTRIAVVYETLKQFDKAAVAYKKVIAITKKIFSETHIKYLSAIYNLANMYEVNQQYALAIESFYNWHQD